jgi:hypothetical protein
LAGPDKRQRPYKQWVVGLSYEAGLGDCTAEAPFDVAAQNRLRTLSKEVLIKKFSDL